MRRKGKRPMGLLTFPSRETRLVGDASVWINLIASKRAEAILAAIPNEIVITDVALRELEGGRARGRDTIDGVETLINQRAISVVSCPQDAEALFFDLVGGTAVETLDDGEACTLACAIHTNGAALIDEKKATNLAARRFPDLPLFATTDLVLS